MNTKQKKKLILDFINGPLREYFEDRISFGKFKERINEVCGTDFYYSDLYPSYLFNAELSYKEADEFCRSDMGEGERSIDEKEAYQRAVEQHNKNCVAYQEGSGCEECLDIIPGTFIMCGEGVGSERQYCSTYCWEKAKNENHR